MIPNYYYLMASLPMLRWGREPPLDQAEFLERCAAIVPPEDLEVLQSITLVPPPPDPAMPPVWRCWSEREYGIRVELAQRRSRRLNQPWHPPGGPVSTEPEAALLAERLWVCDHPQEAEDQWDHQRWQLLDDLEWARTFSLEGAIIYLLRLLILQRRAQWNAQGGSALIQTLTETATARTQAVSLAREQEET